MTLTEAELMVQSLSDELDGWIGEIETARGELAMLEIRAEIAAIELAEALDVLAEIEAEVRA
jgi:hypothetical protein